MRHMARKERAGSNVIGLYAIMSIIMENPMATRDELKSLIDQLPESRSSGGSSRAIFKINWSSGRNL